MNYLRLQRVQLRRIERDGGVRVRRQRPLARQRDQLHFQRAGFLGNGVGRHLEANRQPHDDGHVDRDRAVVCSGLHRRRQRSALDRVALGEMLEAGGCDREGLRRLAREDRHRLREVRRRQEFPGLRQHNRDGQVVGRRAGARQRVGEVVSF